MATRAEAGLAAAVGLLVLVRPRPSSWLAASAVAASALAAVLLYRYVDVGSLGPLPDMYENTWQVPGKLLSAYAEAAAIGLAGLGLLTHRSQERTAPSRGQPQGATPIGYVPESTLAASEHLNLRLCELAGGLEPPTCCLQGRSESSRRCWRVLSL